MFTPSLKRWAASADFPPETIRLITGIFSSPPSRAVEAGTRNVSGAYPSRKMGVTIQFESHRHELAHIIQWEHHADVVAYVCQPPEILFTRPDVHGRKRSFYGRPDFFVVSRDFTGWVEVKPLANLEALAKRQPHHYVQVGDRWTCPPGERHAKVFKLGFAVHTEEHLDRVFIRNCEYLEDYLQGDPACMEVETRESVLGILGEQPGILLEELFERERRLKPDTLHAAIVTGGVYVDLSNAFLGDAHLVQVFADRITAEALKSFRPPEMEHPVVVAVGKFILWQGQAYQIVRHDETKISLLKPGEGLIELPWNVFERDVRLGKVTGLAPENAALADPALKILAAATEDAKESGLVRFGELERGDSKVPARTQRDWRQKQRLAHIACGSGLVGLLDGR